MTTEQLESTTINDLLLRYPATVEVFNRFGIDACCGGDATVAEGAERDGATLDDLLRALEEAVRDGARSGT
jgi:regulator of cell morphogenesis and NO signaling